MIVHVYKATYKILASINIKECMKFKAIQYIVLV